VPNDSETSPGAGLTRGLSLLVIALMAGAIGYTAWIVLRNWSHIGV
jgi:hypothetical protein